MENFEIYQDIANARTEEDLQNKELMETFT